MSLKKELGILLGIVVAAAVIFGPLWWRPAMPCVAGDLAARAQARVPEALKEIFLDAERLRFGFGAGAIGGWEGLGDAVAAGGLAWVRTTRAGAPKYFGLVSNRYFQSNGFVYVPHGREPVSSWRLQQPVTLTQLWETLARQYPEGVMFSGYVRAAPLHLIAIARPAIDGRAVLRHAAGYYTRPMESVAESWTYVAGIAAANSAVTRFGNAWLAALLAPRPGANGAGLAHGLRLRSAPAHTETPPTRANVQAVGQLVADRTTLVEGELRLYAVTRAGGCDAAVR